MKRFPYVERVTRKIVFARFYPEENKWYVEYRKGNKTKWMEWESFFKDFSPLYPCPKKCRFESAGEDGETICRFCGKMEK